MERIIERLERHRTFCNGRIKTCTEVLTDLHSQFNALSLEDKDARQIGYYLTKIEPWSQELKTMQDRLHWTEGLLEFVWYLMKEEQQ